MTRRLPPFDAWLAASLAMARQPDAVHAARLDASAIASGSALEADVAVVGAGPSGIVIALELARAGHRVLLIDSGEDSPDADTQRLGELAGSDPAHVSMSLATSRRIGGASNLWGGRCVPFDPIDFERRPIVADSRWPVAYDELEPFFQRACDWCLCGKAVFDARSIPELASRALVPGFPDGEVSASSLERWSLPTNFAREYRAALADTPGLTVVTKLTCTEIVCAPDEARVSHLRAQSLDGKELTVSASQYVLACGGLEATRLLFASNRRHADGIGNHSGHLGRWYMAHVESRVARVRFTTPPEETIYGHERDSDGVYVRRRITFSPELQLREGLPNVAIWLVNPSISDPAHGSAVLSFVYLALASPFGRYFVAEGIRQAHIKSEAPVSIRAHALNVLRNLPSASRFALTFGYQRFLKQGRKVPGFFVASAANTYPLLYHAEHLPNRDSRVEPAVEKDALGMPRLSSHLQFSEEDVAAVMRAHRYLDDYLRDHGLGSLEYLHEDPQAAIRAQLFGGYHQAGTTRMSELPDEGVVDRDLAVHGFSDLYVASSSTFVTSGQANSTFMLIVLALRLADHLKSIART
jgi:choline dehydrogenase-like flavoprotein